MLQALPVLCRFREFHKLDRLLEMLNACWLNVINRNAKEFLSRIYSIDS